MYTDVGSLHPLPVGRRDDLHVDVVAYLRAHRGIARRRDLLAAGFGDGAIAAALATGRIFRVRHGWYAATGTSDVIVRVIRVGGRLTGLAALKMLGMYLPPAYVTDIAVPRNAAGLRDPANRRERLRASDGVRIHWVDPFRGDRPPAEWMTSEDDALLCVLRHETREVAVACCDALLRYRNWDRSRLARVFELAPKRTHPWLVLVDGRADAWGETVVRLRLRDAGIPFEPQASVLGVPGRFDGRVSAHVYVEVDGRQHDESWDGPTESSFERDHEKDIALAIERGRCIRITYRQLGQSWPDCLAAIRQAIADDLRP